MSKYALGWRRQLPDIRDRPFTYGLSSYPPSEDLRTTGFVPPTQNQLTLGACTGHGIAEGVAYAMNRQHLKPLGPANFPSRLAIYYGERLAEGTVNVDAGANIRDGIKVVAQQGVCDESLWPYDISKFATPPSQEALDASRKNVVSQYMAVEQTEATLKGAIAAGYGVVVGISVYNSFMSDEMAKTGVGTLPSPNENLEGGHCVWLCGYTPTTWILLNSWGLYWGMAGFFTLPTEYLVNPNLSSDFWAIEALAQTS